MAKEEDFAKKRLQFQRREEGASGILGSYRPVHVKPNRDPNQVEVVIATSAASDAKTVTIRYDLKATKPPTKLQTRPISARPTPRLTTTTPRPATRDQGRDARCGRGERRGDNAVGQGGGGRRGGEARTQDGGRDRRGGRSVGNTDATSSGSDSTNRRVTLPPGV